MNSPVVTASPGETVDELAAKMVNYNVGSVVIIRGNKPLGIVTDGDIVRKSVFKDQKPSEAKTSEIMSRPLITIDADKDITDAARLMRQHRVKRLGITYKGRLVGIVSVSDLAAVTPEIIEILWERERRVSIEPQLQARPTSGYCDSCEVWFEYLTRVDGKYLCENCRSESSSSEAATSAV